MNIAYENAWQYDAAGNRTQTIARTATQAAPSTFSRVSTTIASLSANDWLTTQTTTTQVVGQADASSTKVYGYDRNGAQVGERVDEGAARLDGWNFEGHLKQSGVDGQVASSTRYSTDATGVRVAVDRVGETSSYLVDPNTSYAQVVQEWNKKDGEAAVLAARYVWEDTLAPLVMWRRTTTGTYAPFFYLADGQDSVRQLTNAAGEVTDSYHYNAFGGALGGGSGNTPNPFRYTGQQDEGGGRYFLRARYYDTGSGRFLSHDPLMGNSSDPVSMHRYLYANGDGVNFSDPTGKFALGGFSMGFSIGYSMQSRHNAAVVGIGARVGFSIGVASRVAVGAAPAIGRAVGKELLKQSIGIVLAAYFINQELATGAVNDDNDHPPLFRGYSVNQSGWDGATFGLVEPVAELTYQNSARHEHLREKYNRFEHYPYGFTAWTSDKSVAESKAGPGGYVVWLTTEEVKELDAADKLWGSVNANIGHQFEREWFIDGVVYGGSYPT